MSTDTVLGEVNEWVRQMVVPIRRAWYFRRTCVVAVL